MKKSEELADPASCLNKAKPDELLFVILERDDEAADTIRFWARRRVMHGKNKPDDPKIQEAMACAQAMENAFLKRLAARHVGAAI